MQQKTKPSAVGSTVIEGMMIGGYSEGTEITL
jgi:uncharacterized protein YqhQ